MIKISPIPLGPMKRPLDTCEWDRRCVETFGRKLPIGTRLTREELFNLGFVAAAEGLDSIYDREVIEQRRSTIQ